MQGRPLHGRQPCRCSVIFAICVSEGVVVHVSSVAPGDVNKAALACHIPGHYWRFDAAPLQPPGVRVHFAAHGFQTVCLRTCEGDTPVIG